MCNLLDKKEQIEVDFLTPDKSFSYDIGVAGYGFEAIKPLTLTGDPYPPFYQAVTAFFIFLILFCSIILGALFVFKENMKAKYKDFESE